MGASNSVKCPKCGTSVPIGKMKAELSSVNVVENNVHFVVRRFRSECPQCGPFLHDRLGHHGTIGKKQMEEIFPRAQQRRIRDALPTSERKPFMRTMNGKREPKEGEIERWTGVQKEIRKRSDENKR
jgi:ribosomal protein S27AE